METFYIVVLSVATILLILILAYFGIVLQSKAKSQTAYPPKPPNNCPDYWSASGDGKGCQIPDPTMSNSKNLGTVYNKTALDVYTEDSVLTAENTPGLTGSVIQFSDNGWTAGGKSAVCTQKSWANTYGVVWDGISNYNGCG